MITIAVVSYGNQPDLLKRCIGSLVETVPADEFKLIVCLNECTDEARAVAQGFREKIDTLLDSAENIGIEGAITLALHACRTDKLLRLDDDSWVLPGWWDPFKAEMDALPEGWGAMGRLHHFGCYLDVPPMQGYVSKPWVRLQPWYKPSMDHLLEERAWGVSGGFCLLNVTACMEVGYPQDNYPHFEEDVVLSLQMRFNHWTLHDSKVIKDNVLVRVGDAPSRTNRKERRQKWKGEYH